MEKKQKSGSRLHAIHDTSRPFFFTRSFLMTRISSSAWTQLLAVIAISASLTAAHAAVIGPDEHLPEPKAKLVERGLTAKEQEALSLAARRYYAFWNTGEERYAKAALAPNFTDQTLPAGRAQGLEGPLAASRFFRAAVPDLKAEVEEMLQVGDRVIGRLHFTGHFTGTFGSGPDAKQGDGRAIDFIATDIYRVRGGKITDNWHIEDNLTLLKQMGVLGQ
jgi:predicted ester cyclase